MKKTNVALTLLLALGITACASDKDTQYLPDTTAANRVKAELSKSEDARLKAEQAKQTAEKAKAAAEDAKVQAEQKIKALEEKLAAVPATANNAEVEDLKAQLATAKAEKIAAEQAKVQAEEARENAEQALKTAETAQKTAEAEKATAENAQKTAEAEKVKAETAQKTAEAEKVKAENAQKVAENAKEKADKKVAELEKQLEAIVAANSGNASQLQKQLVEAKKAQEKAENDLDAAKQAAETAITAAKSAQTQAENAAQVAKSAQAQAENAAQAAKSAQTQAENEAKEAKKAQAKAEKDAEEANAAKTAQVAAEQALSEKVASLAGQGNAYFALQPTSTYAQKLANNTLVSSAQAQTKDIAACNGPCSKKGQYIGKNLATKVAASYAGYSVIRENNGAQADAGVPQNAFYFYNQTPTTNQAAVIDAGYDGQVSYTRSNGNNIVTPNGGLHLNLKNNVISGKATKVSGSGNQSDVITFNDAAVKATADKITFAGATVFHSDSFGNKGDIAGTYHGEFAGSNAEYVVGTFESNTTEKEKSVQGAFSAERKE